MSDSWIISVGGRAYGPYSPVQMQAFVTEGRVLPQSLVARPGDTQFHAASDMAELAGLFRPAPGAVAAAQTAAHEDQPGPSKKFGRSEDEMPGGGRANYLIVADMKSQSITGLEEEIFRLGPAYPVLPQAWILNCELSANAVRNHLIQKLGKLDLLFVADATRNKAAWYNYAPEADVRIRRIWQRAEEAAPQRAAG